jgi:syntaxin 16
VVDTIVELAQIMRDLSTLVVEQGTMLDRIDANITDTAVKVWGGGDAGPSVAGRPLERCW